MSTIRILSLDGGGTRAGILAKTLGQLYGAQTQGRDIIRQFDFIAGNSGGSIVMTALCCNYTPQDIAAFYDDPATLRRLFSPKWSAALSRVALLRTLFPPYSATGKFAALKEMFDRNRQSGEPAPSSIRLHDWPGYLKHDVNLLVTAYDFDLERVALFRSNPRSLAKSSAPTADIALVDAVHASTNAPIFYFDKPAEVGGHRYWDGGLAGHDNPVLAAVVEALANAPTRASDIRVLSLGTGAVMQAQATQGAPPPLGKAPASTSVAAAFRKAARAIFADPPSAANFHAYVALGQSLQSVGGRIASGNMVRLSPLVRPVWIEAKGEWDFPGNLSSEEFRGLMRMEMDAMAAPKIALIRKMTDLWIAGAIPNQPIRMGDRMCRDIGHETFSEAAAHWKDIM